MKQTDSKSIIKSIGSGSGSGSGIDSMMKVIYNTFIIVGLILVLLTFNSTDVTGIITGYAFIMCGILLLICYFITSINGDRNETGINKILSILYTIGPFLLIICILIYSIYLLLTYKDRISEGNVAPGYTNFTSISIILLCMQLYLFYLATNDKETNFKIDKTKGILLYFLGLINFITVITIGIILSLFNTDG